MKHQTPNPMGSSIKLLVNLASILIVMAVFSAIALLLDDRSVLGRSDLANVWSKPMKFQLSMAIQLLTVAYTLKFMNAKNSPFTGQSVLIYALILTVIYEVIYITFQGARGMPSHFNNNTNWEKMAGTVMASGAYVLVGTSAWIGLVAFKRWYKSSSGTSKSMYLSIALGFIGMFILAGWTGSALGQFRGPYVSPLPSFGSPMPLTGWRLDVGDLRISHFMGVHMMQAIPLFAYGLSKYTLKKINVYIWLFAITWAVLTIGLMRVALNNQGLF